MMQAETLRIADRRRRRTIATASAHSQYRYRAGKRSVPIATSAIPIVLLLASVGITFLPGGLWRQGASLVIACMKAGLIFWLFMGLKGSPGLVRLAATGAVTFLAIMLTLLSADYSTRGWLEDQVATPKDH